MTYRIFFKSYDLRRKNVLVYGVEELDLIYVKINTGTLVEMTNECEQHLQALQQQELSEEERNNLLIEEYQKLNASHFQVTYNTNFSSYHIHENVANLINEHKNICSSIKEFNKDLLKFENIDYKIKSKLKDPDVYNYDDYLVMFQTYINELNELCQSFCEKYGTELTVTEKTIPTPEEVVQEHINQIITEINTPIEIGEENSDI